MTINYILMVIFALSAPVSGLSWYCLRMEYLERNKLNGWHYFALGKSAHKETMRGNPVMVRRYRISTILALASIALLFIGNVVKANG